MPGMQPTASFYYRDANIWGFKRPKDQRHSFIATFSICMMITPLENQEITSHLCLTGWWITSTMPHLEQEPL